VECLACHDSHGSETKALLAAPSASALCKQCHPDVTAGKKFVHGPVAAEACGACHQPHASAYPKLLNAQGKELCLTCHVTTRRQMESMRFVHGPVNVDCQACHDAHASDEPMMVKQPPAELCLSCHEQVREVIEKAAVKHAAVTADRACLNCHQPHASNFAGIIKAESGDLCLTCHDKAVTLPDGSTVGNVKQGIENAKVLHGPVAQGNCSGCHVVHGGDHYRLLTREYPGAFYAPFKMENYALCFSCHEGQIVRDERTTTLTGFRNGDLNLHYVHVNKQKGRSCRACHATHASNNDKHVRDAVPYGKGGWMLPINYQPTANGGKCAPGCHTPYAYDRVAPVAYPPEGASTQPAGPATPGGTSGAAATQGVNP
jgi:predicted CXXCH cytochrome family protein